MAVHSVGKTAALKAEQKAEWMVVQLDCYWAEYSAEQSVAMTVAYLAALTVGYSAVHSVERKAVSRAAKTAVSMAG